MRRTKPSLITVYKYHATPVGQLPTQLWIQVRAGQMLWNKLALLYGELAFHLQTLPEADHKALWAGFDECAQVMVKASGLNWEQGPDVLERFHAALKRRRTSPNRGRPLEQMEIEQVMIPHRFTSGGADVAQLFSDRATRFRLERMPDAHCYSLAKAARHLAATVPGVFGLDDGKRINFRTELHRPLPPDATIKRVQWCGYKHPYRGWQWWITITVEQSLPSRNKHGRWVRVDLAGLLEAKAVTVAHITDGNGLSQLLRVPLAWPNRRDRRDWSDAPNRMLCRWSDVQKLRQRYEPDDESAAAHRDRAQAMKLSERLIDRRRHLYRNMAAWCASTYDVLVCDPPPRVETHFVRGVAALSELRSYLEQAARKHGCAFIQSSQMGGLLGQSPGLRKSGRRKVVNAPKLPPILAALAVAVQSG